MMLRTGLVFALLAILFCGCSSEAKPVQVSGKVTFRGQPVPAGYVQFTPDVAQGGLGQSKVFQIKDGAYDSSKDPEPGIRPGKYQVRIAGFDGKKIPYFGQGKQIFNPVQDNCEVAPAGGTKDFVVPDSAGENVKIERTADT